MKRDFICIVCPLGCLLYTDGADGDLLVTGNSCDKGVDFARKEIINPERILTTTVKLTNGGLLPVRSNIPVKKHEMIEMVTQLKSIEVTSPVVVGQIIIDNFGENSVNIIATDNIQ